MLVQTHKTRVALQYLHDVQAYYQARFVLAAFEGDEYGMQVAQLAEAAAGEAIEDMDSLLRELDLVEWRFAVERVVGHVN